MTYAPFDEHEAAARQLVAGWGFTSRPDRPLVLDDATAERLERWAGPSGVDGVMWNAIESGSLEMSEAACERAHASHLRWQHRTLLAEGTALVAVDILSTAGIESRVLKGIASAHLDHPQPSLRTSNDADLLVARRDLIRAIDLLDERGFIRHERHLGRRWERRFGRAATLRVPSGADVDVHATIGTGYFGRRLEQVHDLAGLGSEAFDLGGAPMLALDGPARLLTSCYAAVLSRGPRLRLWRDIATQLTIANLDWRAAVGLAAACDGTAVIARGILDSQAETHFETSHPSVSWARQVDPDHAAARALGLLEADEADGWTAEARSTMLALGSVDRARFVSGIAAGVLTRRRSTPWSDLTRAARLLKR